MERIEKEIDIAGRMTWERSDDAESQVVGFACRTEKICESENVFLTYKETVSYRF